MSEENDVTATGQQATAPEDQGEERAATPAPNDDAPPASAEQAPTTPQVEPPTAEEVRLALRKVKDPELNLNIVDLGLVYDVVVEGRTVKVDMSLTSPACPSGPQLMSDAERAVRNVPGVEEVNVNLVWQPLWTPDRIEPRVRAYMGL